MRPLVPHQDVRPESSDGAKLLGQRNLTRSGWPGLSREDPTTAMAAPRRSGARVDGMANSGELLINDRDLKQAKGADRLEPKR